MTTPTIEQTLAQLRAIQDSPRTAGWDSRGRVEAIKAFVYFHHGAKFGGNLTEAFVALLIAALEHESGTAIKPENDSVVNIKTWTERI